MALEEHCIGPRTALRAEGHAGATNKGAYCQGRRATPHRPTKPHAMNAQPRLNGEQGVRHHAMKPRVPTVRQMAYGRRSLFHGHMKCTPSTVRQMAYGKPIVEPTPPRIPSCPLTPQFHSPPNPESLRHYRKGQGARHSHASHSNTQHARGLTGAKM